VILVIDNYDSFTYNLVQYLGELGAEVEVHRNDRITVDAIAARRPEGVLISPGPGAPRDAGVSLDVIRELGARFSIFGVCLGHQSIGEAFGGRVVRAERLMHGRTSLVEHDGRGVFEGLPSPFTATRYHSLIVDKDMLPDVLEATAFTPEGELMGLRHRTLPIHGVQFHPEAFLTEHGHAMLRNWLRLSREHGARA
jgi:para-aminobenzoate synthetase component II